MDTSPEDVYAFIKVYLSLSSVQRRPFLVGLSKLQCELIRQISYNLLINKSITLTETDRKYLLKYNSTLRTIASRRFCLTAKRDALVRKAPMLLHVFRVTIAYIDSERRRIAQLPTVSDTPDDASPAETADATPPAEVSTTPSTSRNSASSVLDVGGGSVSDDVKS